MRISLLWFSKDGSYHEAGRGHELVYTHEHVREETIKVVTYKGWEIRLNPRQEYIHEINSTLRSNRLMAA